MIHPEIDKLLKSEGIPPADIYQRYSDAQINCESFTQAHRIARGGPWRALATVFQDRTNGKPSVEIAFAFLSDYVTSKTEPRKGDA